jgi:hypothetical protein
MQNSIELVRTRREVVFRVDLVKETEEKVKRIQNNIKGATVSIEKVMQIKGIDTSV